MSLSGANHAPVLAVMNDAIDCLLFGSGGVFAIPAGGTTNVAWREKDGCFRVTLDIKIMPSERRGAREGIGARRVEQWEAA